MIAVNVRIEPIAEVLPRPLAVRSPSSAVRVLADRGFCSYVDIARLAASGVDVGFRLHQRRPSDFRQGRPLGPDDRLVAWIRPKWIPSFGLTREEFGGIHEFLAIATHHRIYSPPTPIELALAQVDCWMESPSLIVPVESDGHWQTLRGLIATTKASGPAIHDARIVAICIDHGVRELWSADRDFSRWTQLRVVNPLVVG